METCPTTSLFYLLKEEGCFLLWNTTANSAATMNSGRMRIDGNSGIIKSSSLRVIC